MKTYPEDEVQLPLRIEELTAELLTELLSFRYPGVVVKSLYLGDVILGTAAKVRLLLAYNAAGHQAGLPATMVLKIGFVSQEVRELVGSSYAKEIRFFRDWAPRMGIKLPQFHFAGVDAAGQGALLMEDLSARNVTFGSATVPLPVSVAPVALDQLARLHAFWWKDGELEELDTYPGVLGGVADTFFSVEHWDRLMAMPRGRFIKGELRDRKRMYAAMKALFYLKENGTNFMLHGDPHPGNLSFDADGSPNFLDWQGVQRGPWAHDVTYFIIGSLSVEDRRANEKALLHHYLEKLAAHGGPRIGFDEAWMMYRRHAIYEFINALTPTEYQPEPVGEAHAERGCAALEDLGTLEALCV